MVELFFRLATIIFQEEASFYRCLSPKRVIETCGPINDLLADNHVEKHDDDNNPTRKGIKEAAD
jgi:hypothetical protein